jgi:hypothetical protein
MNFDELEKLWGRQTVSGGAVPAAALAAEMQHDIRVAQRRIRGGIVIVGTLFALDVALSLGAHVLAIKRVTPIGLAAEVTFFALYFLFLLRATRSARAVRQELAALGGTLRESAAATLRTVELQIENARLAAYAIPGVIAVFAGIAGAKYLAGELRLIGVEFGLALMMSLGLAIGAAIWHRWRTVLKPRRAELRELLRSLERDPAP